MSWDWDVRAFIALFGTLVVVVQIYLARRKEQFESTMWLFDRLQSPDAANARFKVRQLLAKARREQPDDGSAEGFSADLEYDFDKLHYKDRAQLASIGSLFGLAGLLYRRRRIHRRLFLEAWGNSVIVNFERLTPYMRWRDGKLGRHRSLWRDFENLAAWSILKQPR